ncbi:RNA polymerase sigma factor [Spirosoma endophyticum]|uniref:RNA polymerase sigma-70 factor, ECF subfamily n=1 Tax=Spirosoma endophyticum TaxID=662367 RepID=A0A1I1SHH2_9BACT|nr:sigma-70 family RNA polymerase sigma factor [Spirosoma endophyticum]SFD45891.1 RNA polymerase sigma-70 factor, ECF subfamily [Spirosoma endophyticum]
MNVTLTDEEMIRHYLPAQPNQLFETLYNRYVNKVYKRCLYMTKDSEKAQDFTHDIFIKAFDKLDAFQERANFSTWLNTIAFNYCSDQLRIAKRLNTTPLNENHELADSREAGLQEETFQSFQQALASLPLKEQTLLRLKYEQGMTVEEIAQIYRLKTSAVKMRLKRSREKLQQLCSVSYAD